MEQTECELVLERLHLSHLRIVSILKERETQTAELPVNSKIELDKSLFILINK